MADAEMTPVQVLPSVISRAARLAEAMTDSPDATPTQDAGWTVEDVITVAIGRGLDALERQYLSDRA